MRAMEVASYFVWLADRDAEKVTNLKLQKLVYLAHGWYLGIKGKPLIDEPIQAWQYGPVVKSLYNSLKVFGKKPIHVADLISMGLYWYHKKSEEVDFLESIWEVYGQFSASRLVTLTHSSETPWDRVYEDRHGAPNNVAIPQEYIKDFFYNLAHSA